MRGYSHPPRTKPQLPFTPHPPPPSSRRHEGVQIMTWNPNYTPPSQPAEADQAVDQAALWHNGLDVYLQCIFRKTHNNYIDGQMLTENFFSSKRCVRMRCSGVPHTHTHTNTHTHARAHTQTHTRTHTHTTRARVNTKNHARARAHEGECVQWRARTTHLAAGDENQRAGARVTRRTCGRLNRTEGTAVAHALRRICRHFCCREYGSA
jgi:hypothetical protein